MATIAEVRGLSPIFTTTAAVATDAPVYVLDSANSADTPSAWYFSINSDGDQGYIDGFLQSVSLTFLLTDNTTYAGKPFLTNTDYDVGIAYGNSFMSMKTTNGWSENVAFDGTILTGILDVFRAGLSATGNELRRYDAADYAAAQALIDNLITTGAQENTLVYDGFVDANGTALAAHTPNIDLDNGGWITPTGAPTIQNNELTDVTSGVVISHIDAGESDVVIAVDGFFGKTASGNSSSGITFRYTDDLNHWLATISTFNSTPWTWAIREVVAGVTTNRAETTGASTGDASVTVNQIVTCEGTTIRYQVPDEDIDISYDSATFNETATKHGPRGAKTNTPPKDTTWDNFVIIDTPKTQVIQMTAGTSGPRQGYETAVMGTLDPDNPFGFTINELSEQSNDITLICDGIQLQTIFETIEIDGVVLTMLAADTFTTGGGVSTWTFLNTTINLISTTVYPVKVQVGQ